MHIETVGSQDSVLGHYSKETVAVGAAYFRVYVHHAGHSYLHRGEGPWPLPRFFECSLECLGVLHQSRYERYDGKQSTHKLQRTRTVF